MVNLFFSNLWEAKLPLLALASVVLCLVVFVNAVLRKCDFIRLPVYLTTVIGIAAFFVYWEHPEHPSRNQWLSLGSMVLCIASVIRMNFRYLDDDHVTDETTHEPVHVSAGKTHHCIPIPDELLDLSQESGGHRLAVTKDQEVTVTV